MFERYTEKARRVIFFARYEASTFGSHTIETHHLLLGILNEDKVTLGRLSINAVRKELLQRFPPLEKIATSVDLPLSHESKRVLAYGAEEAERLKHRPIDTCHLVLGLLREEKSVAAELLRREGIDLEAIRRLAAKPLVEPIPAIIHPEPAAGIAALVARLVDLIDNQELPLSKLSAARAERRLANKPWTRKEALGHLIDWATTYHHWLVRALTEPKLVAPSYPLDEWVKPQDYRNFSIHTLVSLWFNLNLLIVHQLAGIPEAKLTTPCRIGLDPPVPLSALIARYVEHCEDVLAQILTRG